MFCYKNTKQIKTLMLYIQELLLVLLEKLFPLRAKLRMWSDWLCRYFLTH